MKAARASDVPTADVNAATEHIRGPRERVYDEEIQPIVNNLIDLCREYGIPIVIGVELDHAEDGSGQTTCVSFYQDEEPSSGIVEAAAEMIVPGATR